MANVGIVTGQPLVVLDIDGPIGQANLALLVLELGELPDTPWVASGRHGGYHLYFRYPGGPVRTPLREGLDVRGDGHLVVAPPSLHHLGRPYQWANCVGFSWDQVAELPEVWVQAITPTGPNGGARRASGGRRARRPAPTVAEVQALGVPPLPVRGLSLHITALVRLGDVFSEYPSSSEVFQAIVTAGYAAGLDAETMHRLLANPENVGGERMRSDHCPEVYFTRSWTRAAELAEQRPLPVMGLGALSLSERTRTIVRFGGLLRPTVSAVLESHLDIVTQISSTKYGASVREIEIRAGVNKDTVVGAHQELVEEGWLIPLPSAGPGGTSQWMLSVHKVQSSVSPLLPMSRRTVRTLDQGHDLFSYKCLGKGGWRTLVALHDGLRVVPEIAKVTVQSTKTVRRHLTQLEGLGLAAHADQGEWHHRDLDLDEIATQIGAVGVRDQRRKRQDEERAAFAQVLRNPVVAAPRKVGPEGLATGARSH